MEWEGRGLVPGSEAPETQLTHTLLQDHAEVALTSHMGAPEGGQFSCPEAKGGGLGKQPSPHQAEP